MLFTDIGLKHFRHTRIGGVVLMPRESISGMTAEDLGAMYDYLRTLKPINNKVEKFKLNAAH